MKYEHFQKYLLYKYYSSFLSKNFIPKSITNMSNKQLQNYLLKLKILNNYSKKSYVLRQEYTELCINEDERDIGHKIAIDITKKYNYDVLQCINKITSLIKLKNNYKISQNQFDIFIENNEIENTESEDTENIENQYIDDIENEVIEIGNKNKIEESDDDILDKIILEKQKIVNNIYNILKDKFDDYKIKYSMSLLYMTLQTLSLRNFDIIFNRLSDDKRKLLNDIILDTAKFDFVKLVIHVRRMYMFTRPNDNNIEDIIYCDVILKGETRVNPIFLYKYMKISFVIEILYIQLIITRIKESDRETFLKIIDGRLPKLTKNFKSRNNILDCNKYVYELINNNNTLYLYLDY